VLHLAAEWRPEALRQSPEQARQLNVDAAGRDKDQTGRSLKGLCHLGKMKTYQKSASNHDFSCVLIELVDRREQKMQSKHWCLLMMRTLHCRLRVGR
jgi:hypothetical protein